MPTCDGKVCELRESSRRKGRCLRGQEDHPEHSEGVEVTIWRASSLPSTMIWPGNSRRAPHLFLDRFSWPYGCCRLEPCGVRVRVIYYLLSRYMRPEGP